MKKTILSLCIASMALYANAKVQLPGMISDNMVLQQSTDAALWGKADPGKTVTVKPSWTAKTYSTKADKDGKWMLEVATPAASYTPYSITFSDGEPLTIGNVLIGEVWLASGQSNMQLPLKGFGGCPVQGGFEEIAGASKWTDKIRFVNIPMLQSHTPMEDTKTAWVVPSTKTAPDFSATAWFCAQRLNDVLDIPIGIVNAPYGGARVESWLPREILETYPDVSLDPKDMEQMVSYWRPMLMYNAMFVPIKDYTYKGILWYQGCSNVSSYQTFTDRLATMVKHWRDEIGQGDIPFYSVEIAPYQYDSPIEQGRSPYLREAQWKACEIIPNSYIIGTNDMVEPYERHNIHPGNKAGVGRRLGNMVLNKTYGHNEFLVQHPRYVSHRVDGNEMWVKLDGGEGGICRNYDIRGFELAGEDKVFHPADSAWWHWETNEVVLSSKEVPNPVAVRYCFHDWLPGTMYGGNFLPLAPFRSDDWEILTD